MQICNATYDRQLDLLDCRASMLGFDLYAIESGDVFEELNRRCFNCSFQEACAVDLRRDPTSPVWETYLPQRGNSCGAGRGLVGHTLTCAALARSALGGTPPLGLLSARHAAQTRCKARVSEISMSALPQKRTTRGSVGMSAKCQ